MMTQAGFVWRDPREVMQETTATLRGGIPPACR
jgi:hypothetical protein